MIVVIATSIIVASGIITVTAVAVVYPIALVIAVAVIPAIVALLVRLPIDLAVPVSIPELCRVAAVAVLVVVIIGRTGSAAGLTIVHALGEAILVAIPRSQIGLLTILPLDAITTVLVHLLISSGGVIVVTPILVLHLIMLIVAVVLVGCRAARHCKYRQPKSDGKYQSDSSNVAFHHCLQ